MKRNTVTECDSTTGNPVAWQIQGIDPNVDTEGNPIYGNSVARVRSQNLKGKTVSKDRDFCQIFIDFDIRLNTYPGFHQTV